MDFLFSKCFIVEKSAIFGHCLQSAQSVASNALSTGGVSVYLHANSIVINETCFSQMRMARRQNEFACKLQSKTFRIFGVYPKFFI